MARTARWLPLVAAGAAVLLVRTFVLDVVAVESDSMRPTYCPGDVLVVLTAGAASADAGDVVVLEDPSGDEVLKRVVGVPGQRLEILDGVLHVEGGPVVEEYVDPRAVDGTFFGPVVVPDRMVFVMGDEREGSIDSRTYGPVPRGALRGRVVAGGCG